MWLPYLENKHQCYSGILGHAAFKQNNLHLLGKIIAYVFTGIPSDASFTSCVYLLFNYLNQFIFTPFNMGIIMIALQIEKKWDAKRLIKKVSEQDMVCINYYSFVITFE